MKSKIFQWIAIVMLLEMGLLHFITAQSEYEKAAYLGYLFMANFLGALIAAYSIYYQQKLGWMLGIGVAAGSIAGYAWSRTLGLPGLNVEEWLTPFGIVAVGVEAMFILLSLFRPWKILAGELQPVMMPVVKFRFVQTFTGLLTIALISVFAAQWDVSTTKAYGHHVGSLDQICRTPFTSFAEIEEKYGVEVSLVATSMMNSIVDVRLKVIDPVKAHDFLQNQAALLVNQQALVLAPHMHSHVGTRLKAGKMFIIFFPTQKVIKTGSEVSLVFGNIRFEPLLVK